MKNSLEIKWASILLALLAVVWAAFMLRADGMHLYMIEREYENALAVLLLISGLIQGAGAWLSRRPIRQAGLWMSGITWFALCIAFLGADWKAYAMALGFLGLLTFSCYLRDVLRKPRDKRAAT